MHIARFAFLLAACAPAPPSQSHVQSAAPPTTTTTTTTTTPTPTPIAKAQSPVVAPSTPTCAPVDEAKITATKCDDSILTTPIPPIVDGEHSLTSFYTAYAAAARDAKAANVHLAMYGDSNLTMDEFTGHLRREEQKRFGDAGHGFVALALPWHWYEHQDIHHFGKWADFRQIATSTHQIGDQHYGMANMAAESRVAGASVWVSTADAGSPIGTTISRADIFFLKQKLGGSFDLIVDGVLVRTVSARSSSAFEVGIEHLDLPDAPHKITCTVKTVAPVRFFGAALERGSGSVVVDSLGVSALSFAQLKFAKPDTRKPMYEQRDYKLVIFQIGTNTFAFDTHHADVKRIIKELRQTLPGVSILLMTPPDEMNDWNDAHSDKRIVRVSDELREIALENKVAFWDYRGAMGGDTSIKTFIRKGLAQADRIHFKKEGSELMADRFRCAVEKDFRAWLAEHPNAGCALTFVEVQ